MIKINIANNKTVYSISCVTYLPLDGQKSVVSRLELKSACTLKIGRDYKKALCQVDILQLGSFEVNFKHRLKLDSFFNQYYPGQF